MFLEPGKQFVKFVGIYCFLCSLPCCCFRAVITTVKINFFEWMFNRKNSLMILKYRIFIGCLKMTNSVLPGKERLHYMKTIVNWSDFKCIILHNFFYRFFTKIQNNLDWHIAIINKVGNSNNSWFPFTQTSPKETVTYLNKKAGRSMYWRYLLRRGFINN